MLYFFVCESLFHVFKNGIFVALNAYTENIEKEANAYKEELRLQLAYRLSVLFSVVFFLLTYTYFRDSFESGLLMCCGLLVALICFFSVHYRKVYQLTFWLLSVFGVLMTSYALVMFHEVVHLVEFLWLLSAVLLGFAGLGKRVGVLLLVIALSAIFYFIFFSLNVHIETVQPKTFYQQITLVAQLTSGFVFNFYLLYFYLKLNRYSAIKLKEVNEKLLLQHLKITQQNNEKLILVKEIHHRVKNNLQIVISLLRLQILAVNEESAKRRLQESVNRLMSMAFIHQKLYRHESLSQIDFTDYASDLVRTMISIDNKGQEVEFSVHAETDRIGLKSLVSIGLIVNELVSNSLKHAFSITGKGNIEVSILKAGEENRLEFSYRDDGTWVEQKKESFGLMLVESLVEQLGGTISITKNECGTSYRFVFDNADDE